MIFLKFNKNTHAINKDISNFDEGVRQIGIGVIKRFLLASILPFKTNKNNLIILNDTFIVTYYKN